VKGKFTQISKGKIEDFIEESGGKIDSDLNNSAQVLIVGENAGEDISRARLLGVTIVDQSQFAHLAGGKTAEQK
jgi:NAD-dependent DNA ligase